MNEYLIEIFNPNHTGYYPKKSVFYDNSGYFVINNIPFFYYKKHICNSQIYNYTSTRIKRLCFFSSLLFAHKHFPVFCFSPFPYGTIHIKSNENFHFQYLLKRTRRIIECKEEIDILDNQITKSANFKKSEIEKKRILNSESFIDFSPIEKMKLTDHFNFLSNKFQFSEFSFHKQSFINRYNLFSKSSRYVFIALYYYFNAGRLMNNNFIEEAGVNLNLVLEAIIYDFMIFANMKDKKAAIEELVIKKMKLKEEEADWLMELRDARNEFLAHIDKDMFTSNEKVNDPDGYCFDHWEPIGYFLLKYIKVKLF